MIIGTRSGYFSIISCDFFSFSRYSFVAFGVGGGGTLNGIEENVLCVIISLCVFKMGGENVVNEALG